MKIGLVGAIVVILAAIGATEPLLACGEKFLMRSRGTRFQRAAPARMAANILVYDPARALANVQVDATLRKVGYKATTVTSPEEFKTAMARSGWDLLICDVADCGAARSQSANRPAVLPVALNPTKAQLSEAKKQHGRILKAPTRSQAFVDAVDDALADKSEGQQDR